MKLANYTTPFPDVFPDALTSDSPDFVSDSVRYWTDSAAYDYSVAKTLYHQRCYLYVGFFCHMAVEKSLKAAIASRGNFPPKTHVLTALADKAGLKSDLSQEQLDFLTTLEPLNTETRYPTNKSLLASTLSGTKCKLILKKVGRWIAWTQEHSQQLK